MNDDFKDKLKRNGLKITKHRLAVLDILEQSACPLTAEQIFLDLRDQGVLVSLSTVYRTLELLSAKGIASRLSLSGRGSALFECKKSSHSHHLVCTDCNRVLTIERCPLRDYEKTIERETDFLVDGHKLDVYGRCPRCRGK